MYKDISFCEASTGVIRSKPICNNTECERHKTHTSVEESIEKRQTICWADFSVGCQYYQEEYET